MNAKARFSTVLVVVLTLTLLYPCTGSGGDDGASVVESNNAFALDLYGKLSGQKGNIFFSPYSISTALAMTCAGAKGNTEAQMAKTLRFTLPKDKLHPAYGDMISDLSAKGKKGDFELSVANALWGQEGFKFLDDYLALVEKSYDGGLNEVDFARGRGT